MEVVEEAMAKVEEEAMEAGEAATEAEEAVMGAEAVVVAMEAEVEVEADAEYVQTTRYFYSRDVDSEEQFTKSMRSTSRANPSTPERRSATAELMQRT